MIDWHPLNGRKIQDVREEELRDWSLDYLFEISIAMGRQCNVRCQMCYQTDFDPASKQADIVWKEKLLPAYEKAKLLTISGGEPTIISSARSLVQLAMKDYPHLQLSCITNGQLFRGTWIEAFAKQGFTVNFSINTVNPELYPKIVQFGRQKEVFENIDATVRRRDELKSELIVGISTVILDETIHEMSDFITWAADRGVNQVSFLHNQLVEIKRYEPDQVQKFIAEAYETAHRYPKVTVLSLNDFDWYYAHMHRIPPVELRQAINRTLMPCITPFDTMAINPDGFVYPCCRSWYLYGNLIRQPLDEVWNGEAAYKFRRRMLQFDFRDCRVECEFNCRPINYRIAQARRAYWVFRRGPKTGFQKTLRALRLTKPQIELSAKESKRLEQVAAKD
jgi:radical SAM protein with 4Fe4S-binding SPASM domain